MYPEYTWDIPSGNKELYLTFDDGPHPQVTPWVLDELKKYGAKATFFCIGDNVTKYPATYRRILDEGHAVGNHTFHHLNGWKVPVEDYLADIKKAAEHIHSSLFRPPYGRIKRTHLKGLNEAMNARARVIMWDVLSADFDPSFTPEQCLQNVVRNATPGSIIVFHDSEKANRNLTYALPGVLQHFSEQGCLFKKIEEPGREQEWAGPIKN